MTQRSKSTSLITEKPAGKPPKEPTRVPSKFDPGDSHGKLGQTWSRGS